MSIDIGATRATLSDRVAEEIRAMLGRRRMSGRELARKLDVSASWVSYRLTGSQPIDLNDMERIAEALDVGVADLLPRRDREVTRPYVSPTSIPVPRNPLKGIAEPKRPTRTGRTMADPSISQPAQRASARSSRQLQPCG